jgi:hypothetical protein
MMDAQSKGPEQREFTRIRLAMQAVVAMNGKTWRLPVRDVSLAGIGLDDAVGFERGATCTVELRRLDAPDAHWIVAQGTVVRVEGNVAGIQFVDLVGIESLHHLRALIMLNAEDPDQVEDEFNAHWGIRRR